jgi:hypothetical protein
MSIEILNAASMLPGMLMTIALIGTSPMGLAAASYFLLCVFSANYHVVRAVTPKPDSDREPMRRRSLQLDLACQNLSVVATAPITCAGPLAAWCAIAAGLLVDPWIWACTHRSGPQGHNRAIMLRHARHSAFLLWLTWDNQPARSFFLASFGAYVMSKALHRKGAVWCTGKWLHAVFHVFVHLGVWRVWGHGAGKSAHTDRPLAFLTGSLLLAVAVCGSVFAGSVIWGKRLRTIFRFIGFSVNRFRGAEGSEQIRLESSR